MRLLLVLIALSTLVGAAEHRIADLVAVAESRPTAWDFRWQGESVDRAGSDAFDRAWAGGLGGRWGWGRPGMPHHLLVGVDVLWVEETVGDGGLRGPLLRLAAGYGYGLSDRVLVTLLPSAGFGMASFRLPGGAAGDSELSGRQFEVGIRAGLRCRVGERWLLGIEAGWLQGWDSFSDDTTTLDIDRRGLWTGLSVGYLLEAGTRSLE